MKRKNIFILIVIFLCLSFLGILAMQMQEKNGGQEVDSVIDKTISDSQEKKSGEESENQLSVNEYLKTWNGDTSNWKIYKNEKLGIEFKYPPEVLYVQNIQDSADIYSISLIQNTNRGEKVDAPGKMTLVLNDFQSEKGYILETEGECRPISIFGEKGDICSEKERIAQDESAYLSFVNDGVCAGSFLVNFNLSHYSEVYTNLGNPDGRNRLYISCDLQSSEVMKIFQSVFRSISFSGLQE